MFQSKKVTCTLALLAALLIVTAAQPSAGAVGSGGQKPPAAAPAQPPKLNEAYVAALIDRIAVKLEKAYNDEKKGKALAERIRAKHKAGAYAGLTDPLVLADRITADLHGAVNDKHLRVNYSTMAVLQPPDDPAKLDLIEQEMKAASRKVNGGFRKAEILPGNVGYVKIDSFLHPSQAGEAAEHAMAFVAGADALLFDLRDNGGGRPELVQLVLSYLFRASRPVHLNTVRKRENGSSTEYWTLPHVNGTRMPDVPVYVLTSSRTFSAAEEFAYDLQALKRGIVVGETTGGGANPTFLEPLGDGFALLLPKEQAVNPHTGTNWEGVGVKPDMPVPASEALGKAYLDALGKLLAKARTDEEKRRLQWAIDDETSRQKPVKLEQTQLSRLAGAYSGITVESADGGLSYKGEFTVRLIPVTAYEFRMEGIDDRRIRFETGKDGSITGLITVFANGMEERRARMAK